MHPADGPHQQRRLEGRPDERPEGRPLRVLVVEDEMMVAMLVEDMLTDMGHVVVGPALHLDAGLELAREADIDFAVLDVNLAGRQSFPVADALRARGVPFMFATGYGTKGLTEAYANVVTLKKPFQPCDFERAFARIAPPGRAA